MYWHNLELQALEGEDNRFYFKCGYLLLILNNNINSLKTLYMHTMYFDYLLFLHLIPPIFISQSPNPFLPHGPPPPFPFLYRTSRVQFFVSMYLTVWARPLDHAQLVKGTPLKKVVFPSLRSHQLLVDFPLGRRLMSPAALLAVM